MKMLLFRFQIIVFCVCVSVCEGWVVYEKKEWWREYMSVINIGCAFGACLCLYGSLLGKVMSIEH